MPDLVATARSLYGRLGPWRSRTREPAVAGELSEADGAGALDALEASICAAIDGPDGRGRLATALGLSAAGERAAVDLWPGELSRSLDLLHEAARRRLPLVVHLVAGHDAYHGAASSGAVLLFATDVQDAVDLTLLAHRLAEEALVPVVVAMDGPETAFSRRPVSLPSPERIRRFLGRPEEPIHPPTPSQATLFGKHRRRRLRWHDPERPLLHGAVLDAEAFGAAELACRAFFDPHVPELLSRVGELLSEATGRNAEALRTFKVDGARHLLLVQGAAVEAAEKAVRRLRSSGVAVGSVALRVLRPLPASALTEILRGRRSVAVLERVDAPLLAEGPLTTEIRALLEHALREQQTPRLASAFYGLGGEPLQAPDLERLVRRHSKGDGDRSAPVYLGFDTASAGSEFPKRQALQDALRRSYPELASLGLRAPAEGREEGGAGAAPMPRRGNLPAAVRRLGRSASPVSDLPTFWDRTAPLYRDGGELLPDPFLAARAVPPLAAALRDTSVPPETFPVFDPAPCTGCGVCWTVCPDNAIVPAVVDPTALLDLAMARAKDAGASVDKLRMVTGKLAAQVRKQVAKQNWDGGSAGTLFDDAIATVLRKSKLPDGRKDEIRQAWDAVRATIAELPLARTAPFFDEPPAGGSRLFTLALDADACKGCGLCVTGCEPGALAAAPEAAGPSDESAALRQLVEELPEPDDATIEHARGRHDVGPLAGALLSRPARDVMAGGHTAEPGSGEALALRQVLGAAEYHLRPRRARQLEEIRQLKSRLAEAIHERLADALPDHDLEALSRGLNALRDDQADLSELTTKVETALDDQRVDVMATRRLVDAARAVADLEWRLETGEGGFGGALFGLVVDGRAMPWAVGFPHNPFRVPVTVDTTGDAVDLARGLVLGQLRETVKTARVLRRARLELDRPDEAGAAARRLAELDWNDLSDEERRWCPPVFLVTGDDVWRRPLAELRALFDSNLPIQFLVLTDSATEDAPSCHNCHLLFGRTSLFVQSSVAHFSHLENGWKQALDAGGPAILRILAPSPVRRGIASDRTITQARQSVDSGSFALLAPDASSSAEGQAPPADTRKSDMSDMSDMSDKSDVSSERAALERRHAAEIAALRREYETRLATERARYRAETAQHIRARLLQLATAPREVRP